MDSTTAGSPRPESASADSRSSSAFVNVELLWNPGCGMFCLSAVSALIAAMGDRSLSRGGSRARWPCLGLVQPLSMLLPGHLRLQNGAIAWDLWGPTRCEVISPIEQGQIWIRGSALSNS